MRAAHSLAARLAFLVAIACAAFAPLAVRWPGGRTLVWFDTQRPYAPERWLVDLVA